MPRDCPKCDATFSEGDEVYDVRMQDRDAPAPDLEFYTITVCSKECVQKLSRSGNVRRVSNERTTFDG